LSWKGYVFKNAASIRPYLEQPRTGVTSQFCSEIAQELQCVVFAGYPEALSTDELNEIKRPTSPSAEEVGANSAVVCGPDGEFIGNYRKTNLFETDKTWAKAGR
jgi:protein N-terminal amidase